jgi:ssDNA-binding Zn-finger/Zn-ribbon topoisomerase 1
VEHGTFITLNGCTGDARQLAESHNIEILNETGLAGLLEGMNLHENPRALELLFDTTKYCPKCERLMIERIAEKGPNPGQHFWGCTGYPKCRFTMPL